MSSIVILFREHTEHELELFMSTVERALRGQSERVRVHLLSLLRKAIYLPLFYRPYIFCWSFISMLYSFFSASSYACSYNHILLYYTLHILPLYYWFCCYLPAYYLRLPVYIHSLFVHSLSNRNVFVVPVQAVLGQCRFMQEWAESLQQCYRQNSEFEREWK